MELTPTAESFATAYDAGQPQLVWTRLVADLETPVSAMLKLMKDGEPCFLLESVEGGETRGRHSIIGLRPDLLWQCQGDHATLTEVSTGQTKEEEGALDSLRRLLKESHIDIPEALPPMAAGIVGYLAYDTVRLMEKLPDGNPDTLDIPDGCLMRPTVMAIFDSVADVIFVIAAIRPQQGVAAQAAYRQAHDRILEITGLLEGRSAATNRNLYPQEPVSLNFSSNLSREEYHAMVEKAKDYIRAGDIFQVVPSQRFSAPFILPPFSLYRSLRHLNPSPFLFFLNFGDFQIIGSSPEILVRSRAGTVTIRPIAGTRPRGKTPEEDKALEADLLADPKERAEHLMLLDLGRNDVGRVAKTGTVKVTEEFVIERYSHVMHIVSNVEGTLDSEKHDAIDALCAGFPAGTVSGAPKIRAMEIIDELEPVKRKFYAGCVGYFSCNGDMDTAIALRTALVKDGQIHVQAGGGVVADSDPEAEYQESCNKAKAVMRAAEAAGRFV